MEIRRSAYLNYTIILVIIIFILLVPKDLSASDEYAPDFSVYSSEGELLNLRYFRGKVVVLNMVTTYCPACHKQFEELREIYFRYPNIIMITVVLDSSVDLKKFKRNYGIEWYLAQDTDNIANKYNVIYIPTTIIIDVSGKIHKRYVGLQTFSVLSDGILSAGYREDDNEGVDSGIVSSSIYGIALLVFIVFSYTLFPFKIYSIQEKIEIYGKKIGKAVAISWGILVIFLVTAHLVSSYLLKTFKYIDLLSALVMFVVGLVFFTDLRVPYVYSKIERSVLIEAALHSTIVNIFLFSIYVAISYAIKNIFVLIALSVESVIVEAAVIYRILIKRRFIDRYKRIALPTIGLIYILLGGYFLYIFLIS